MSEVKNSPQRSIATEVARTLSLFLVLAVFYGAFGVFSLYQSGDWIGFVASLPFVLATVGVVGTWMTLIRRDASTAEANPPRQRSVNLSPRAA